MSSISARFLEPTRLSPLGWLVAIVSALAVGVGGYFHGHLFHEGYAQIDWVGPLFFLNALGSAVVIALLVLRRALLFAIGSLTISVGSLVSILISHSTSFFGFAEHRFDTRAQIIVIAESVAIVLTLMLFAFLRGALTGEESDS
jgi:hypothetical protein